MNSNLISDLTEGMDSEAQPPVANAPPAVATTRRRVICERCGENHRTSTHDKCIAEGRPLPGRRRDPIQRTGERRRPNVAALQPQVRDIGRAAILDENDEEGDNDQDGQLPNLADDDIESSDDDDENDNENAANPRVTGVYMSTNNHQ
jgi:hypothetical protein